MSDYAQVKILGAKTLGRALAKLGTAGARKCLRAGAGKAVTILKKFVRKEIPAKHKRIKKSVGSKVKVSKKEGVIAKVGLNIGKKAGKGHAPHAMIYVGGTQERKQKTTGRPTGRMPANPVVQRGVQAGKKQAIGQMKKKMREVFRKEAQKRK